MVNLSKKIFGLAGTAAIFAGMAFGQTTVNCNAPSTPPTAGAFLVRGEGTTEQVADLNLTCTGTATAATGTTANFQVFLSAPVTSKVLSSSSGATEALLIIGGTATQGTIGSGGSSLQFNNVAIPTTATGGSFAATITNVRVNASTVTVGTGAPPAITESVFVSGPAVTASASGAVQVAFVQNGLGTTKSFKNFAAGTPASAFTASSSGTNSFVVCNSINAAGTTALNVIQFSENYATAFKGQGSAATNGTLGSEFTNNTETGYVPTSFASGGSNIANSGTRIKVVFNNVPANLSIYVPVSVTSTTAGGGIFTLTSSETGAFSAVSAVGTSSKIGPNLGQVSLSGGTGAAVYEYFPASTSAAVSETFNIPVQGVASANSITASSTAITESLSFAPVGSTNIPNFVVGASTSPITSSTFNLCTTSLLFPFVTNQLGFDTGLAIANTSTDPFGGNGATAQSGTCTLNFYGAGAPTPSNVVTPNIPTGTVYTQVLSAVGAGFQGYLIAQCQFQFAHGFAFVTDGVGANGGLSQGYLAGVIPDVNQKSRGADPLSAAGTGTGETLGN